MSWLALALVSVIGQCVQAWSLGELRHRHPIHRYMAIVFVGAAALTLLWAEGSDSMKVGSARWAVVAGMASMVGMHAYNKAIGQRVNLGTVEALVSLRAVLLYGFSLFGAATTFEPARAMGVALTAPASWLVANGRGGSTATAGARNERDTWRLWSVVAAGCFAILALAVRGATAAGGEPATVTGVALAVSGVGFTLQSLILGSPPNLRSIVDSWPWIVAAILGAALGNLALYAAFARAPNLGLPAAVGSLRIVILFLVAAAMRRGTSSWSQFSGVVVMVIALVLLGIGGQ